jgi:hypothetical protein
MNTTAKVKFLVCHNYGMGGLWAIIFARSRSEIMEKFADLEIIDKPPLSMTQNELREIEAKNSLDIDDEPSGWLKCLGAKNKP